MGDDGAFGFLRVLGSAMARLTEAESALVRAAAPDIQMNHTRDELTTAQAYRAISEFMPRITGLIDAVHRHHIVSARTHFEGVMRDLSGASVQCGVGFADLSGFTALTQSLTPAELSMLLDEFNATVSDVVHSDGGRVVKFIGDEVMWVSSTPEHWPRRRSISSITRKHARRNSGSCRARLRRGAGHQRRLFRQCGQPRRQACRRRGARADPCHLGRPRRTARVARCRPGTLDTQGFRVSGDCIRPAPSR